MNSLFEYMSSNNCKCVYKGEHKVTVVKNDTMLEEVFQICIYAEGQHNNNILKISMMNTTDESESYTSMITREDFDIMKSNQNLIVAFESFAAQLKTMLGMIEESRIKIRMTVAEDVTLGFYSMSMLKELTILTIPFAITSVEEIIHHFKTKIEDLTANNQHLVQENKSMSVELAEKSDELTKANDMIHSLQEKLEKMELTLDKYDKEKQELDEILSKSERDKILLVRKIDDVTRACMNERAQVLELQGQVRKLHMGMDQLTFKLESYRDIAKNKLANTVSIEKYEQLNTMFSAAVADLLKCQVNFDKVLALHDLKKVENQALRDELTSCVETIKKMEVGLKEQPEIDEKMKDIIDMIARLDNVNTNIEKSQTELNQKMKSKETGEAKEKVSGKTRNKDKKNAKEKRSQKENTGK